MHPSIFLELFDLSAKLSNIVIEEISDNLENHSVRVDKVEDFDTRVYFHFSYPTLGALTESSDAQLSGLLVIDRLKANYEVLMKFRINEEIAESVGYTPLYTKDFDEVLRYIMLVNEHINDMMYQLLPKRAYRTVFNEDNFTHTASNYERLSIPAKSYLTGLLQAYNKKGITEFDIGDMDPEVVDELMARGYALRRGNILDLDTTMADSLRAVVSPAP